MPRKLDPRPVIFSDHALERSAERNVPTEEAERIIRHGPAWESDGVGDYGDPKWIARGVYDGRDIGVVFVETTDGKIEVLEVLTVTSRRRGR